jgi:hypothetical protein
MPDGAGAYPAYGYVRFVCLMALALARPTGMCGLSAGWRWRLSGLRVCAVCLPDGAGAYPAYEYVRFVCRMALALIRPTGMCGLSAGWRWRLSGLRVRAVCLNAVRQTIYGMLHRVGRIRRSRHPAQSTVLSMAQRKTTGDKPSHW